ncbi:MAG TPA: hypothetical protein VGQ87_03660 [Patescibacteria group bacterium]|jgi:hypothetical protein|nr:hypothetical protein [Patescibacteria group bacterium]
MARRAENREQQPDFSLSWDNKEEVLKTLNKGEAVNILVSQSLDIILSMESHKEIQLDRGLEDDQILMEGLVEDHGGRLYIDSNFHGASKMAESLMPEIENKLNDAIEPLLRRAA